MKNIHPTQAILLGLLLLGAPTPSHGATSSGTRSYTFQEAKAFYERGIAPTELELRGHWTAILSAKLKDFGLNIVFRGRPVSEFNPDGLRSFPTESKYGLVFKTKEFFSTKLTGSSYYGDYDVELDSQEASFIYAEEVTPFHDSYSARCRVSPEDHTQMICALTLRFKYLWKALPGDRAFAGQVVLYEGYVKNQ